MNKFTASEINMLIIAESCGMGGNDPDALLAFVRQLVGDINAKPMHWAMESEGGAQSLTHYAKVADEYRNRPGYIVSAVYPRRVTP